MCQWNVIKRKLSYQSKVKLSMESWVIKGKKGWLWKGGRYCCTDIVVQTLLYRYCCTDTNTGEKILPKSLGVLTVQDTRLAPWVTEWVLTLEKVVILESQSKHTRDWKWERRILINTHLSLFVLMKRVRFTHLAQIYFRIFFCNLGIVTFASKKKVAQTTKKKR